jgi:hypothetical protein
MTDAYLDLWPTYGSALIAPTNALPALVSGLAGRGNIAVIGDTPERARQVLLTALRLRAKQSYDQLISPQPSAPGPYEGWLVIDVPIPNQVTPVQLVHRMIRRLYFASVLHGLGEVPAFRETMQALRIAFLQTRGSVSRSEEQEKVEQGSAEVGVSLKAAVPEFSAKLTAGDEVKVVERLSAEMERLDLFEAEDELMYDLKLLQRLDLFVSAHAQFLSDGSRLPRWERVRSWFKHVYELLHFDRGIVLRPAFVFEANSTFTVIELMRFLSQAAGLARAHYAQVLLLGGLPLALAIQADADLGGPILRGGFAPVTLADAAPMPSVEERRLFKSLVDKPPRSWTPEVVAVGRRMSQLLPLPPA